MPGTVLNKRRLQKFIIDVAIFFIPRTEREGKRERGKGGGGDAEKETGRDGDTQDGNWGASEPGKGGRPPASAPPLRVPTPEAAK